MFVVSDADVNSTNMYEIDGVVLLLPFPKKTAHCQNESEFMPDEYKEV